MTPLPHRGRGWPRAIGRGRGGGFQGGGSFRCRPPSPASLRSAPSPAVRERDISKGTRNGTPDSVRQLHLEFELQADAVSLLDSSLSAGLRPFCCKKRLPCCKPAEDR